MTTPDYLTTTPNPGSQAALDLGCQCPVMDNYSGRGWKSPEGRLMFVYNMECPVHNMFTIAQAPSHGVLIEKPDAHYGRDYGVESGRNQQAAQVTAGLTKADLAVLTERYREYIGSIASQRSLYESLGHAAALGEAVAGRFGAIMAVMEAAVAD